MKHELKIDWCTANFADSFGSSPQELNDLLAGERDIIPWQPGKSENIFFSRALGLNYMLNSGFSDRPRCLRFSGVGCSIFETVLPEFFEKTNASCSRLDLTFDIIMPKCDWFDIRQRAILEAMEHDPDSDLFDSSARRSRCLDIHLDTKTPAASTIYIGSRRGAIFARIYNKSLEDPSCKSIVLDGDDLQCPEDSYIIRYELEFKRHKVTELKDDGTKHIRLFDPTALLDWYFNFDSQLIDYVKKVWSRYGRDYLFPFPLSDLDFSFRIKENKNFVEKYSSKSVFVSDRIASGVREYDHTLLWVVQHYGAYVYPILLDPVYRSTVLKMYESKFGFKTDDLYIEIIKPLNDYDDLEESSCDYLDSVFEQINFLEDDFS